MRTLDHIKPIETYLQRAREEASSATILRELKFARALLNKLIERLEKL